MTAAQREGDSLCLDWGQTAEFEFKLPRNIAKDQIVTSRLVVTGYYRRCSALPAETVGAGCVPFHRIL
jgi:hypothetical protein